jgi:predicted Zn-dependent protease
MLYYQSNTLAYAGQLKKARDFSKRASDSALRAEEKETAKGYRVDVALREALFGNKSEAERRLAANLGSSSGQDVQAAAALAYAFAGDQSRAQRLADDLARRFPENTLVQSNYLPAIRGQIAVNSKNPDKALELLKPGRAVELGQPAQALMLNLYPVFVRGNAYLAIGDGRAAQAEFEELLDHPGMVLNEPIGVLAHLGLARAYALQGDTSKAKAAYEDFRALWKNADPDIQALKQANAEYAKLQ